ncbi:MAG: glycosyltransferase [Patescibacteria group bacterium]
MPKLVVLINLLNLENQSDYENKVSILIKILLKLKDENYEIHVLTSKKAAARNEALLKEFTVHTGFNFFPFLYVYLLFLQIKYEFDVFHVFNASRRKQLLLRIFGFHILNTDLKTTLLGALLSFKPNVAKDYGTNAEASSYLVKVSDEKLDLIYEALTFLPQNLPVTMVYSGVLPKQHKSLKELDPKISFNEALEGCDFLIDLSEEAAFISAYALNKVLITSEDRAAAKGVVHGKTGFLFESENAKSLAKCIVQTHKFKTNLAPIAQKGEEVIFKKYIPEIVQLLAEAYMHKKKTF